MGWDIVGNIKGTTGAAGSNGSNGTDGNDGWSPEFALVADSDRYVLQVADWAGGEGSKPATGDYVGSSGLVSNIGDGVNVRGPAGSGDVSGPGSSVSNNFAAFDGTDGSTLKDSGSSAASFAAASHTHTASQISDASANGRSLITAADYAAMRTLLSLVAGTNVQAYSALLAAIAGLTATDGNFIVGNGSTWVAESGSTARTSLGLAIGSDVQAYDADTAKTDVAQTWTAAQQFGQVTGTTTAVAALAIDCSLGNFFTKTIAGTSTFTVSNVPASKSYGFTLELNYTSGTITWFSGVEWKDDTAPTLTGGKVYLVMFHTSNGGTTWRAAAIEFDD